MERARQPAWPRIDEPPPSRLLVIDDEPLLCRALARALCRDGHLVTTSTAPRSAVETILAGQRYDVILCDMMMPDMTGMDVHTALSHACPEQAARLVFVTGGSPLASHERFLHTVANPWLPKPFDLKTLRSIVAQVRAHGRAVTGAEVASHLQE